MICLDVKSTSKNRVPASSKLFKKHQIDSLMLTSKVCTSGFVIIFTEENKACWFTAHQVKTMKKYTSLFPKDGEVIGYDTYFDLRMIL